MYLSKVQNKTEIQVYFLLRIYSGAYHIGGHFQDYYAGRLVPYI